MSPYREINLIPEEVFLRFRGVKRLRVWAGVISMVVAITLGGYLFEKRNYDSVERIIADMTRKTQELEEKISRLGELQEKRNRLARKEKAVHSLLFRRSLSRLFYEMGEMMSPGIWLTSVEFRNETVNLQQKGAEEEEGTATGYFIMKDDMGRGSKERASKGERATAIIQAMAVSSEEMADFLEKLSKSGSFDEVNLQHVQQKTYGNVGLLEFEVEGLL